MALVPWKSKEDSASQVTTFERSMSRLRDEMDSVFDRVLGDRWGFGNLSGRDLGQWPGSLKADLTETDDEVVVTLEAPGVDPKDLDVNVTGQSLTVRGEKRQEREDKKRSIHYVERQFGSFQRSIPLPVGVDAERVGASFKNGVVTIRLPKRPDAKARKIKVKSS